MGNMVYVHYVLSHPCQIRGKTNCPYYRPLLRGIHQSLVVPLTKDPSVMWKVYHFDRKYTEIHSWGTNHFSDGLFY